MGLAGVKEETATGIEDAGLVVNGELELAFEPVAALLAFMLKDAAALDNLLELELKAGRRTNPVSDLSGIFSANFPSKTPTFNTVTSNITIVFHLRC